MKTSAKTNPKTADTKKIPGKPGREKQGKETPSKEKLVKNPTAKSDSLGGTSGALSTAAPGLPLGLILKKALELTLQAISTREILILCLTMAWGLVGALNALFNRELVDAAARMIQGQDITFLWSALGWLGILLLIQAGNLVMQAVDDRKTVYLWRKVGLWCEETLLTKAGRMEYRYFSMQGTINQLIRANNEFANRIQRVLGGMFQVASGILAALSVLVILVSVRWDLPLILLAFSLPSVILYRFQTNEAYDSAVHSTGATRRLWYFLNLLTSRNAMKEIRFGGIHAYLSQRHDQCADEVSEIRLKVVKRYAVFNIFGNLIRYAGFFLVLWMTVDLIIRGQASIGTFALVLTGATTLQDSFMRAANALADIRDSGRYFQDYLHVMDAQDEPCTDPLERQGQDVGRDDAAIVCTNLGFTYPGNAEPTLKDINLTIGQGEKIAIVGENGSGKSTFVSLLCGLYAPSTGSLTLGSHDAALDRSYTRQVVSAALQDYQRYDLDVGENIRLGNPYRELSQDEVEAAGQAIGLDQLIKSWPEAYKTKLGLMDSGGQELSGGEWQKIMLARTLVKSEARIMILDEPTASLDPPSEASLYSAYGEITGDRTSILVSHRLGSCKIADRILVFHQGRIVEQGTHAQLMALGGHYHTMFTAQASWYSHVSQA